MECLEIGVRCHSRLLKTVPFDRSCTTSYLHSIATMATSCTVSEIQRDIGRKSGLLYISQYSTPLLGGIGTFVTE